MRILHHAHSKFVIFFEAHFSNTLLSLPSFFVWLTVFRTSLLYLFSSLVIFWPRLAPFLAYSKFFWYYSSALIIHYLPSLLLSISFFFSASFSLSSFSIAAVIYALSKLSCLIFSEIISLLFAAAWSFKSFKIPAANC